MAITSPFLMSILKYHLTMKFVTWFAQNFEKKNKFNLETPEKTN
jgi:hypothetical protein